jgi:hypothetical protein
LEHAVVTSRPLGIVAFDIENVASPDQIHLSARNDFLASGPGACKKSQRRPIGCDPSCSRPIKLLRLIWNAPQRQ